MTPEEILQLINIGLPIGITLGQALKHIFAGTTPPNVSDADWQAIKAAALDQADAADDAGIKDIQDDQAQNAGKQ